MVGFLFIYLGMKKIILYLLMFTTFKTVAQDITYYDWQWKPCDVSLARFYSLVEKKDSGWLRDDYFIATKKLQMSGLYKDEANEIKNGYFRYFYSNGNLSSAGKYKNDKKEGLWFSFHYNGMMKDSSYFSEGKPLGTSISWYSNGYIQDSADYTGNGQAVYINWFNNGAPASGGRYINYEKEGPWQYFHNNGKLAALEKYHQGNLLSRIYYDEQGEEMKDTANRDRDASFKGNEYKWRNYLENNLEFPRNVKLVNTDIITVVIIATIDEDGNIEDAYVETPFDPLFDDEALRVMKKSPKWMPAIRYNRRVKMRIRQAISFSQE